jgi:ferredoxin
MDVLETMKQSIREALPGLDLVLGWERGWDALHATPLFMRRPEDVDRLVLGPACVQSLAVQLPSLKGKKVGIVVKGCDSRAVVQLLREHLLDREEITIFGFGCEGVVSLKRLSKALGDLDSITSVEKAGDRLVLEGGDGRRELDFDAVCAPKCLDCAWPNAVESDHFAGPRLEPRTPAEGKTALERFEEKPLGERFAFWKREMERCIRCYACRNACPMCVCRDKCLAVSRNSKFVSQEAKPSENFMFQLIHVMHLAGRCVSCGECERACPMDIPLRLLRAKSTAVTEELFDERAGTDPEAPLPLLTFKTDEETIEERD